MTQDYQTYTKIAQFFKSLVETLTTKDLPFIKLYFSNLQKDMAAGNDKFLSQFANLKSLLDSIKQAKGKTAIHFVVASGKLEVLRYLIQTLKVQYKQKDKQGNTPFFTAVEHGYLDIARYLVEELLISVFSTKQGQIGALHIAANNNNLQLMEYLINKGCDIQKVSIYGKPINWAVGSRSIAATKLLLEKGADANGDLTCPAPPPIILAIDFNCEQIYEELLKASKPADIKSRDPQGYSLLHLAAQKGNLKLAKQLVQKGLMTNQEVEGKTPLALAFQNNKWDVVAYLRNFTKNQQQIITKLKQKKQEKQKSIAQTHIDKSKSQQLKGEGNKLFSEHKYDQAIKIYEEALIYNPQNDAIHRNLAACFLNLKKYSQALEHCHQAKIYDAKNVKNLYRQAQAHIGLGNFIDAASSLWQCAMLQPHTVFFKQQFEKYVTLAKQKHKKTIEN